MTVAELGTRMSGAEFSEWQEFAQREPFGPRREDERAGVIAAVHANAYRPKGREPFMPSDFFAELRPPRPAPSPDELRSKLTRWATLSGGKRRQVRRMRRG